jgi:hypothetical protein
MKTRERTSFFCLEILFIFSLQREEIEGKDWAGLGCGACMGCVVSWAVDIRE